VICSPQAVVLEEPNSRRNQFMVSVEQIKPCNSATTPNRHYKVDGVLEECTTDTNKLEQWLSYPDPIPTFWEFQPEMNCALCLINISLPSFIASYGCPSYPNQRKGPRFAIESRDVTPIWQRLPCRNPSLGLPSLGLVIVSWCGRRPNYNRNRSNQESKFDFLATRESSIEKKRPCPPQHH